MFLCCVQGLAGGSGGCSIGILIFQVMAVEVLGGPHYNISAHSSRGRVVNKG